MTVTVRLFRKVQLPAAGYPYQTVEQLKLFDDPAPTEIHDDGWSADQRYRRFRIRHATIYKMEGQVFGRPFSRCLRFQNFHCYEHEKWLIAAEVRGVIAAQALRRLKGRTPINVEPVEVDLLQAKTTLSQAGIKIRGGWFGRLKIEKVDVAYIYGGAVADSAEWEKYENNGKISCLQLEVPHDDSGMVVLLSKDASLTFLKNLKETDYLDYAADIFGTLFPDTE